MERQFRINWQIIVEEAKQRRKAQKITQEKLALLAGVSTPTISRFESGEENIELSSILKILQMLGMCNARRLDFPDSKPKYNYDSPAIILFSGLDGKKKITCGITKEALDDHFDSKKEPMRNFTQNQEKIQNAARQKYMANLLESGVVLVKTQDL